MNDVAIIEGEEIKAWFFAAMRTARQEVRQGIVIFQRNLEAARFGDRGELLADRLQDLPVDRAPNVDERPPIHLLRLFLPLDEAVLFEPIEAAFRPEIVLQLGVTNLVIC